MQGVISTFAESWLAAGAAISVLSAWGDLTPVVAAGLVAALVVSGLVAFQRRVWERLWIHRGWHGGIWTSSLTAIAWTVSVAAAAAWVSIKTAGHQADRMVERAIEEMAGSPAWQRESFLRVYEAVRATGQEDFSGCAEPSAGGNSVPLATAAGRTAAFTAAGQSARLWLDDRVPWMEAWLEVPQQPDWRPAEGLHSTIARQGWASQPQLRFAASRVIQASAAHAQTWAMVRLTAWRSALVLTAIFAQVGSFVASGWAAHRDLHI